MSGNAGGKGGWTHLDELLDALADGSGGLGGGVGELLLGREGVGGMWRIGGEVGGGHSGDDGEDATGTRLAQIS